MSGRYFCLNLSLQQIGFDEKGTRLLRQAANDTLEFDR